jgi:hypothetical protein
VDILDAEQQRVSAMRDLAQARFVYLMAHLRLHVLAGVFDAGWLQEVNAFFTASAGAAQQPHVAASSSSVRLAVSAASSSTSSNLRSL